MRRRHLFLFLVGFAFPACSGVAGPRLCTQIGCDSGLEVVLEAPPAAPYRIEAELPGRPGRYVVECATPAACNGRAFFAGFTPDAVRIHVVTASGATTHLVQPRYSETRPNGPHCPPVCRTGRAELPALPRSAA